MLLASNGGHMDEPKQETKTEIEQGAAASEPAPPTLSDRMKALPPQQAYDITTKMLAELAGELVDAWDGNSRKGVAKVDGLKMAELRGLVAENRRAAVRLLRDRS
jgi:hypothetical protein